MMCGLYLTFFKRLRGEPIEFGNLFKGFDYFGPSVVATLLHVLPILAIVIPAYIIFYVGIIFSSIAAQGQDPDPAAMFGVMVMFALFWLVMLVIIIIGSIGFTFCLSAYRRSKVAGCRRRQAELQGRNGKLLAVVRPGDAHGSVEPGRNPAVLHRHLPGVSNLLRRDRDCLSTGVWVE